MLKQGFAFFFDILQTIVLAAAIFVVIYLFAAQPHMVRGASMESSFHSGDYILTEKVSYRFRLPQRGEVIVFKAPNRPKDDYIKRVIGLPGETVRISGGVVFINDKVLTETYEPESNRTSGGRFLPEDQIFTVPDNSYFVLGDNRSHSSDSREFGPIEKDSIIGQAVFRYWPLQKFGLIPLPSY
ncbi:signal peptidase I [Candidatus Roizmanbacteria bacterium]|nr:signal peptidase I [Candidatus Roizmanbacteria bacterium]